MARIASAEGCSLVVAVAGVHIRETEEVLRGSCVELVENPSWREGRTGSVQVGLNALPVDQEVLLWPVDHPFVEANTLRTIFQEADRNAMAIWFIPSYLSRGGHPIFLRPAARRKIQELVPSAPLRSLLPSLDLVVDRFAVTDPGVLETIDTPEQYYENLNAWSRRQGSP
jgi:molybdenum cofactor cytidylyltransferase